MSSPNPRSKDELDRDELDRLVRRALKAMVSGQEPPEHIWIRIKLELEKDQSPPPRFRMPWLTLAVQPALTLLLVMLSGIGLQMLLSPDHSRHSPSEPLPSLTAVYVEKRSVPSSARMSAEERDLYLLKTRQRLVSQANSESEDASVEASSLETPPRIKAEPTSSLCPACAGLRPATEGTLLKGGPYEK